MDTLALIVVLLLTLGSTVVFYAWHSPDRLPVKTALAAVGFLVIFVTLFFVNG